MATGGWTSQEADRVFAAGDVAGGAATSDNLHVAQQGRECGRPRFHPLRRPRRAERADQQTKLKVPQRDELLEGRSVRLRINNDQGLTTIARALGEEAER